MPAEAGGYLHVHVHPCLTVLTHEMGGSIVITYPWLTVSLIIHLRVSRVHAHTRRPYTMLARRVGPPGVETCRVQDSSASPRLTR